MKLFLLILLFFLPFSHCGAALFATRYRWQGDQYYYN